MSEPQSLEEAFEELFATAARIPLASPAEFAGAVRALLVVGLEEARAIDEAPTMARAGLYEKQQRRIEALGR